MPAFVQHREPFRVRRGLICLVVAGGLLGGCQRQPPPEKKEGTESGARPAEVAQPSAEKPPSERPASPPPARWVPPKLSSEQQRQLPMVVEMRVTEAYWQARDAVDDVSKVVELAALYAVQGYPDLALECLEHVVESEPSAMGGWYYLGLVKEQTGDRAGALAAYRKVVELDQRYGPVYLRLGAMLLDDDPEAAAEYYRQALERNPGSALAECGFGKALARLGRHAEAVEHYRRAVAIAPTFSDPLQGLADSLQALGQVDAARRYAQAARYAGEGPELGDRVAVAFRRSGLDPEVLCSDAVVEAQAGRFERAEKLIRIARGLPEAGSRPDEALGAVRAIQGKLDEAIAAYRQALKTNPASIDARSSLAQALTEAGRVQEAEQLFREILAERPDHALTQQRFAAWARRAQRPEVPLQVLADAVKARPDHPLLHYQYGLALVQNQKLEEARTQFQQALEQLPELVAARYYLGVVLHRKGDAAGARAAWKRALEDNPRFLDAYVMLSTLALEDKDYAEAIRIVRSGLEQLPEAHVLANTLAWLLATAPRAELRDGEEAVRLAERACELTQRRVHQYLDTLGAAYAEAGRFEDAMRAATRALELAREAGAESFLPMYQDRLARYSRGEPYHEQE